MGKSKPSKIYKKRRAGRPTGDDQENVRAQILQAFLEICRQEGAEAVTLQKVANRSGVALTSVRYHFQMKGLSLTQVALDYISNRSFEWIQSEMEKDRSQVNFDPVQSYIRVQFDAAQTHPIRASFLIYFYYLCTTEISLPMSNKDFVESAQRKVLALIHEGLGMNLYQFNGDTQLLAQQIHLIVMGGFMIANTGRDPIFFEKQKDICSQLAAQLLGRKN